MRELKLYQTLVVMLLLAWAAFFGLLARLFTPIAPFVAGWFRPWELQFEAMTVRYMANVSLWSNVAIAVQSALAAALTVTAITKANPGVATSAAHGLSNGDFVLMTVQGMSQIDGRIFRVASVAANTFQLEGEDTTNYDTFTSGTAQKYTFGTTLATISGLSASGGDFNMIDITLISDTVKKQIPGAANPSVYSFESIWDVADAGLVALKAASDAKAQRGIRITFANSQKLLFTGYIGCTLLATGSAQDKVTTQVVITGYGKPTVYST